MVIRKLPSIDGCKTWLNKQAKDKYLTGFPVIIHFFSLSCGLCHKMLPMIITWYNDFHLKGLKCVGIHHIKSVADDNVKEVRKFIRKNNIPYPVAFDEGNTLSKIFKIPFVPAFYFFDEKMNLRHFLAGEKGIDFLKIAVENYFLKR